MRNLRPNEYVKGHLAESYEFKDPKTFVVHLRKGIRWQDIPPANGRELVAEDIAFHFNRMYGLGNGYTEPSPARTGVAAFKELASITCPDKYTVVFNWKTGNRELIIDALMEVGTTLCIECPDVVKKYGNTQDWHHAIGTGPFILKDFAADNHAYLDKNPNYWGHDERYPENKLPYVDKLTLKIIPDHKEALAEMRAGRIDALDQISPVLAMEMRKSNPEIIQIAMPQTAVTIDPRHDKPPFNDVRVRAAMQMAVDLNAISRTITKVQWNRYRQH